MSDDRRLHIVPNTPSDLDEEAPPTPEELAEAEALRAALDHDGSAVAGRDHGDAPIADALRAAWSPAPLDEPDHEALLARALGDDPVAAPATRIEQAAATRLADELATPPTGEGSAPYQLARALKAAHTPRALDELTHERILKRGLASAAASAGAAPSAKARASRSRLGVTMVALSSAVAAAAVLLLFSRFGQQGDMAAPAAQRAEAAASAAPMAAPTSAAAAAAAAPAPSMTMAAAEPPPPAAAPRPALGRSAGGKASPAKGAARPGEIDAPAGAGRLASADRAKRSAVDAPAAPPADVPATQPGYATPPPAADAVVAAFIPTRSTDDLFGAAPFPRTGGESQRIDRIAMARASDLRQNRFAAWGVR